MAGQAELPADPGRELRAPGAPIRWNVWLGAIVFMGAWLRVAILARGHAVVDAFFVPDDTWYLLSIARSLADGLGPTADGITVTNGFQPLLSFLLVPFSGTGVAPLVPFFAAMGLLIIADAVSTFALGRLGAHTFGPFAGLLAAGLHAVSPVAVSNCLNGLETSLSVSTCLMLVMAHIHATSSPSAKADIGFGLLAGLCLLARVDSVFLVALLGVDRLRRGELHGLATVVCAAAVAVAPWWVYEWVTVGSIIPTSGEAVRQQALMHSDLHPLLPRFAFTAGMLGGGPFVDLAALRRTLFESAALGASAMVGVVLGLALLVRFVDGHAKTGALRWLGGASLGVVALYTLHVPAIWFFQRYLALPEATVTLLVAAAIARRFGSPTTAPRLFAALCACLCLPALESSHFVVSPPAFEPRNYWYNGVRGYAAPAIAALEALPAGARVGAFQSGALSYFAPVVGTGSTYVANLDGVVDARAMRALSDRRLADHARELRLTHFVDWPLNAGFFSDASTRGVSPRLTPVAAAPPQGVDRFIVFRLAFDDPADGGLPQP